jgi:hypothetical protein
MRISAACCVTLMIVLTACSKTEDPAAQPRPEGHTIRAVVTLRSTTQENWQGTCAPNCAVADEAEKLAQECEGNEAFGDLTRGAAVVVTDTSSEVIATGQLGPGRLIANGRTGGIAGIDPALSIDIPLHDCVFEFSVEVADSDVYHVAVGNQPSQVFTRDQVLDEIAIDFGQGA